MKYGHAVAVRTLVTFAFAGTACFDVHSVDPGPAVLDDFEDGDLTPSIRPFGEWSCATYGPDVALECTLAEGFGSATGLSAAFSLADPPDDEQQQGVVVIATTADRPIDLTGSSVITFAVRLTGATSFPAGAAMRLELLCSTAIGENGAPLADFVVALAVPFAAEWSTLNLAISNFGPLPWKPGSLRGGTPACLRAVDGFLFVFDPGLPDGQTGTGVFSIDDVRLR